MLGFNELAQPGNTAQFFLLSCVDGDPTQVAVFSIVLCKVVKIKCLFLVEKVDVKLLVKVGPLLNMLLNVIRGLLLADLRGHGDLLIL